MVLEGGDVVLLCAVWFVVWGALHHMPLAYSSDLRHSSEVGTRRCCAPRRTYLRKLQRTVAYCTAAGVCGFVLMGWSLASSDPMTSLLDLYSPWHQAAFSMSVGHWFHNVWEDVRSEQYMGADLDRESFYPITCVEPTRFVCTISVAHHLMAALCYMYILSTGMLSGLGVQGLIFEVPVILVTLRDFAVNCTVPPSWVCDFKMVRLFWTLTVVVWILCRGLASIIYVYSILPFGRGPDALAEHTSLVGLVLYHVLGVFFTVVNVRILGILRRWQHHDEGQAGNRRRARLMKSANVCCAGIGCSVRVVPSFDETCGGQVHDAEGTGCASQRDTG